MSLPRVSTALAVLISATLAATGCGSAKKDDDTAKYKTAYTAQSQKLMTIGQSLGADIQNAPKQTDAQLVTTFSGLASRTHAIADTLKSLKPPAKWKADNDKLQAAVQSAALDLDAIVKAAKAGDAGAAATATKKLVTDSGPLKDARGALDKDVA